MDEEKKTTRKKTTRKKSTVKRGKKGGKHPVRDANGLNSRQKAFLDAYYVGVIYSGENTKDNKALSIDAAGYENSGERAELHKIQQADYILRRKASKAYVGQLLKDMENELVYHKIWVMQQTKHLYETTLSDQVKAGLLKQMREDLGMNKQAENKDISDQIKKLQNKFSEARKKEEEKELAEKAGNVIQFEKDGTNE